METGKSSEKKLEALVYTEIEATENLGPGKLYKMGGFEVEYYENPPGRPPIARIRTEGIRIDLAYVLGIRGSSDGGILIDCAKEGQKEHVSLSISREGNIALLGSHPPKTMAISENGITRRIKGVEYAQSTIDIEGTPEGVRVEISGTVDAAPRPVAPKDRNSPLMFFLIETNPKDPDRPVYHEVWAVSAQRRRELKSAKLVKGDEIKAVLHRHTYETDLIGGGKEVVTRHNLTKILFVSKKSSPKGQ